MNKIKIVWFILNIAMLIYFSYLHATIHHDAAIPFIYIMFLITFPIGFIVPFAGMFLSFILPSVPAESHYGFIEGIIVPGILFIAAGYIQWFILLPKIKKYLKSKKKVDKS